MAGEILCLQAGEQLLQCHHVCLVPRLHGFMDKPGGNEGLACSGTACQKNVVCLSHPYQLTQFAQPPCVHAVRPFKVICVQVIPWGKSRRLEPAQVIFSLPVADLPFQTCKQELRISRLLFLRLVKYRSHVFRQVRQLQAPCIFHQFLPTLCHGPQRFRYTTASPLTVPPDNRPDMPFPYPVPGSRTHAHTGS